MAKPPANESLRRTHLALVGKIVTRLVCAYLACATLFGLLAVGVASIPRSAIYPHVQQSISELSSEGQYHRLLPEDDTWQLDNYTTAIMLNQACHSAENPVLSAAYNFQWHGPGNGDDQISALESGMKRPQGNLSEEGWIAYGRYWHGYLSVLKPLLVAFDLSQIRVVFLLSFVALLGWSTVLLSKSEGTVTAVVYLSAFFAVHFIVAMFSLSLFFSFFIGIAATVFVQLHHGSRWDFLNGDEGVVFWLVFYFIVGGVTVFFDFLDTPIVTLGLPLGMQVFLTRDGIGRNQAVRSVFFVLAVSLSWAAGYGGLMLTKWVLSSLVTGFDFARDGFSSVVYRSGGTSGALKIARTAGLRKNVGLLVHRWQVKMLTPPLVVALIWLATNGRWRRIGSARWWYLIPLALVGILPFGWYLVADNHSFVHAFITYRDLVVTLVVAALSIGPVIDRVRRIGLRQPEGDGASAKL